MPPRGREKNFEWILLEEINKQTEQEIKALKDEKLKYLHCHDGFINAKDNKLLSDYYTEDYVHLSERGYEKYCEPIVAFITDILKEVE